MSNSLQERDLAITGNPADRIKSIHVTILDESTGENLKTLTHGYSLEETALQVKQQIKKGYQVIEVFDPVNKAKLSIQDISEL